MKVSVANVLGLILINCLLALSSMKAQIPSYEQYQVKDGLPSAEVYDVLCDRDGYIWAATDRGVTRYNGYEFENFTTADGLTNNTNFRIHEDHQGRIWFLAYDASLCYYQNGDFHPHPLNKEIQKAAKQAIWWEEIVVHPDNSISLYERNSLGSLANGIVQIDAQWENLILEKATDAKKIQSFKNNTTLLYSEKQNSWHFEYLSTNGVKYNNYLLPIYDQIDSTVLVYHPGFVYQDAKINRLALVKNNRIIEQYTSSSLIHNVVAIDKQVFVCSSRGLTLLNKENLEVEKVYFSDLSISNVAIDKEGNMWLSTVNKGLFKVPVLATVSITQLNNGDDIGQIQTMESFGKSLLFGASTKKVFLLEDDYNLETIHTYQNFIPRFLKKHKGKLLLFYDCKINLTSNLRDIKTFTDALFTRHSEIINDSIFIYSSGINLIRAKVDLTKNKYYHPHHTIVLFDEVLVDFEFRSQPIGFIATVSSLHLVNILDGTSHKIDQLSEDTRISDLQLDGNKNLFISTLGNGLGSFINNKYKSYSGHPLIASQFINNSFLENDSTLWLATNKGADRISYSIVSDSLQFHEVRNFSTADGLVSDYINNIVCWNDHIVVGTDQGLSFFKPNDIPKEFAVPDLQIEGMEVNGQSYPLDSTQDFSSSQSNISFRYTANAMRASKTSDRYHFRLLAKGVDTSWNSTNARRAQFTNLTAGDYTFQIRASNSNGSKFTKIQNLSFSIQPHFTKSWWFIGLLFLLGFTFVYFLVRSRINRIKRKAELEKIEQRYLAEVNTAQLAALRSQMNPHFIFNSLNSIQNFIFKNDVRQANHFLAKFSRLIRESLVLSELEAIPLTQEVEFIKDYLGLEQMRFPGVFDYEIKFSPALEAQELMIPPLLIQPILENSIRHGFKGLDRKGLISIQFEEKENSLFISIIDNGIGMTQAQKEKDPDSKHISFATKIITNRLKLINEKTNGQPVTFEAKERKDKNGKIQGVTAKITLPQID